MLDTGTPQKAAGAGQTKPAKSKVETTTSPPTTYRCDRMVCGWEGPKTELVGKEGWCPQCYSRYSIASSTKSAK